ncbi:hypothetical protein [Georgenia sp. SUBG003]
MEYVSRNAPAPRTKSPWRLRGTVTGAAVLVGVAVDGLTGA